MAYLSSGKLIKDLTKQECLRQNLYETALTEAHRASSTSKELVKPESIKRSVYESALTLHCQKLGLKSYLEQMTQVNLTTLYTALIEPTNEKPKKHNKIFLVKCITRIVIEDFNKYFETLDGEEAKIYHALTESRTWTKVVEELTLVGLEIFLFTVQAKILAELCSNFKYETNSNNPTVMVTAILMGSVPPKKEAPAKKKITFSKKKLPLKKGLTFHDIFQHYYNEELVEYCRKHGMKVSGNKKQLVERILDYVNNGVKEIANAKRIAKADAAQQEKEEVATDDEEEEEAEEEAAEEEDQDDVELEAEDREETPEEAPVETVVTTPTKLKKSGSSVSKIVNPVTPPAKKANKKNQA